MVKITKKVNTDIKTSIIGTKLIPGVLPPLTRLFIGYGSAILAVFNKLGIG
ncbi:hypothetical protein D082_03310 [Synechocystis sp. PCC 6714]|nr:hypothetical protein D082_03310 [Synechocystis sp. PCC 6714]